MKGTPNYSTTICLCNYWLIVTDKTAAFYYSVYVGQLTPNVQLQNEVAFPLWKLRKLLCTWNNVNYCFSK